MCSLIAHSIEADAKLEGEQGKFATFTEMGRVLDPQVKRYFATFVNLINIESQFEGRSSQFKRETGLSITQVSSNKRGGTVVVLEKEAKGGVSELQEQSFVNLNTINNITFSKGLIVSKESDFKPFKNESLPLNPHDSFFDFDFKLENFDKYFVEIVRYTLEFQNLMSQNFSQDALGGLNPCSELQWTIETEALSSFSYSLMRSNVLALCIEDQF